MTPKKIGINRKELGAHEIGFRDLSFHAGDLWDEWQRLQDLGGSAMNEPVGDDDFGYVVYCREPFGNLIELTTYGGYAQKLTKFQGVSSEGDYRGNTF